VAVVYCLVPAQAASLCEGRAGGKNRMVSVGGVKSELVSIVVPTYLESQNLRALVERITAAMAEAGRRYEIVIVDDNSQDGTEEVVSVLCRESYPVRLIVRVKQRGLSSAVVCGFGQAKGEILVCMDGDLSHPPEVIPILVGKLVAGRVEMAVGSRYAGGGSIDARWGWWLWFQSRVATFLAGPFTQIKDPMSGFFVLRRAVFEQGAGLDPVGYKIGLELMVKCGIGEKVCEVPIHFSRRLAGRSKLGLSERVEYLRHLVRLARFRYGGVLGYVRALFAQGSRAAAETQGDAGE